MTKDFLTDDIYLTTKEVGEILRVGDWTLRSWRRKGTGPDYIAVEGNIRYPRLAIDSYLKSRFRGKPN